MRRPYHFCRSLLPTHCASDEPARSTHLYPHVRVYALRVAYTPEQSGLITCMYSKTCPLGKGCEKLRYMSGSPVIGTSTTCAAYHTLPAPPAHVVVVVEFRVHLSTSESHMAISSRRGDSFYWLYSRHAPYVTPPPSPPYHPSQTASLRALILGSRQSSVSEAGCKWAMTHPPAAPFIH